MALGYKEVGGSNGVIDSMKSYTIECRAGHGGFWGKVILREPPQPTSPNILGIHDIPGTQK